MPLVWKGTFREGDWRFYNETSFNSRDSLVPGTYDPSETTTGVYWDVADLTVHNGDYATSQADEVVENLFITGQFKRNHAGTIVRNCWINNQFVGSTTNPNIRGYTNISGGANKAQFIDCTIYGGAETVYNGNGFQGADATLLRCNMYGTLDAFGLQNSDVDVISCFIHDLPWYSYDPAHTDGSHNDGIQIHGGQNYYIYGNRFELGYKGTSGILAKTQPSAGGNIGNLTISKNTFISTHDTQATATSIAINLSDQGVPFTDVVITDNVFTPGITWKSGSSTTNRVALASVTTKAIYTFTGNVDTNGDPVACGNG